MKKIGFALSISILFITIWIPSLKAESEEVKTQCEKLWCKCYGGCDKQEEGLPDYKCKLGQCGFVGPDRRLYCYVKNSNYWIVDEYMCKRASNWLAREDNDKYKSLCFVAGNKFLGLGRSKVNGYSGGISCKLEEKLKLQTVK